MPITVTPLDAALGAEVAGLDLRDIPPADAKALRDAFLQHHVLVIHGTPIGDDDLVRFGEELREAGVHIQEFPRP